LGDAVTRNFQVWGYTFDINLLVSSGRDLRDYEAAVTQFKEGLKRRGEFLDAHITDLYAGCE
ncbi:MAG: spore coat protein CotH, partial [Lachnospiraceae bacterium]|nr:spore coat protein CotH [Lachnospiraceae bacterium]